MGGRAGRDAQLGQRCTALTRRHGRAGDRKTLSELAAAYDAATSSGTGKKATVKRLGTAADCLAELRRRQTERGADFLYWLPLAYLYPIAAGVTGADSNHNTLFPEVKPQTFVEMVKAMGL